MPKGLVKRDNTTKEILLALLKAGCFIIAATSPYFLSGFLRKWFKDKVKKTAWKRAERLRELQKRKIVSFTEQQDGTVKIELTHQGKILVRQYNLDEIKINKPKIWDKKWRLILYDIPEHKKKARDAFNVKLRDLGLFRLQKSLWVSAYDCLPQIEFLCAVFDLNLDKNIFYLEVPNTPKEKEIKDWFEM